MEDSKVLKKGRKIQKFLRKEGKLRNSEPLRFPPAFLAQDGGFNHSDTCRAQVRPVPPINIIRNSQRRQILNKKFN